MEPAIDIITYLWDSRNTWFRHANPDCTCTFESRVEDFLDRLNVAAYAEIVPEAEPKLVLLRMTADEWSDLVGKNAQDKYLQMLVDHHMSVVSEIIALQATESRLGND